MKAASSNGHILIEIIVGNLKEGTFFSFHTFRLFSFSHASFSSDIESKEGGSYIITIMMMFKLYICFYTCFN
jgi:hypothetical protein